MSELLDQPYFLVFFFHKFFNVNIYANTDSYKHSQALIWLFFELVIISEVELITSFKRLEIKTCNQNGER